MIETKKLWVIMSKCGQFIAKGTARNRHLVRVDDLKDRKRLITYSSKGMAESGFKNSWFYTYNLKEDISREDMEAVEVEVSVKKV